MEWVVSAIKYAPELVAAGEAAGHAVNSWFNNDQSAEATADLIKPIVMIGAKVLAENGCQSATGAGVTTAVSSATYDLAVSRMTGTDYGLVKDINNGDYTRAATKGLQEFATGASAYLCKSNQIEKWRYGEIRTQPIFASQEYENDKTTDDCGLETIEDIFRCIADAFPREHNIIKADQSRFA